jgi:hypothetical protein
MQAIPLNKLLGTKPAPRRKPDGKFAPPPRYKARG